MYTEEKEERKETRMLAHKQGDIEQTILEHALGTAELAERFASVYGMGVQGRMAGLLHDIGKFSREYQVRIRHPEDTEKCDHATAGAVEAAKRGQLFIAMCAAGHHSGLLDFGGGRVLEEGTFQGRLEKGKRGQIPDYRAWEQEEWQLPDVPPVRVEQDAFVNYMRIKMLYSALTDADFLDTERALGGQRESLSEQASIPELLSRMEAYIRKKHWLDGKEGINGIRAEILGMAGIRGRELSIGTYTMTVFTGGGKTAASLRFALQHAAEHGMERVIYVIPYTNIIEQTAAVFREILGEEAVLEHHAQVDYEEEDGFGRQQKLAAENWDARLIVTTAVQFFESLFHNKSSRTRKLHNLARSVIVYDEIQMLPVKHWRPCVRMMQELTGRYQVTQLLCTATQPAVEFQEIHGAKKEIPELIQGTGEYFRTYRRVTFQDCGTLSAEEAAERMESRKQVLCIVNTKKTAKQIFDLLKKEEGVFHLSTRMVPVHRAQVLEKIRARLENKKTCRVAATSLVEAGVDLDFSSVMRELAGLDSLLQAAGRCNRSGRRPVEDSLTEVFSVDGSVHPSMQQQVQAARYVMEREKEWDSPEAIETYFRFWRRLRGEQRLDEERILERVQGYEFQTIAGKFHMIDESTAPIYIPWQEEGRRLVGELRKYGPHRQLLRRLGRYSVPVFENSLKEMLQMGDAELVHGMAVLNNERLYDEATGLAFHGIEGEAFFI